MSLINIIRTAGDVQGTIGRVTNFANSLLSFFGSDIVGIFDGTSYAQLFEEARPVKAAFAREVKIMDHPIETGAVISDFAVNLPVVCEMSLIVGGAGFDQIYQQMTDYQKSRTPVTITLKVGSFANMIIEGLHHDEQSEMMDAVEVQVRFREVQYITVQYQALTPSNVATPTDASTVNRGTTQPQQSVLYQMSNFIGGLFK